jgi:hypothetical protein
MTALALAVAVIFLAAAAAIGIIRRVEQRRRLAEGVAKMRRLWHVGR